MLTGRVIGNICGTVKHPFFEGRKLLVVELMDAQRKARDEYVVAVDTMDAGVGDPVLIVDEGGSARQIIGDSDAPVRTVIVGIIDEIQCA